MKSPIENSNGDTTNPNWLAFSLSSHMKTQLPSHPAHHLQSFFHLNNHSAQFNDVVMPLRLDGSLCLVEQALNSSHPQQGFAPHSSPKLEDFLGGSTMGSHPYFSDLSCSELYQTTPLQDQSKETQFPAEGNWVLAGGDYSGHHGPEEQAVAGVLDEGGGDLRALSLSMSTGSQSSCVTVAPPPPGISSAGADSTAEGKKKRGYAKVGQKETVHRKSIETFGQRTSQYRGVTRHRWTGRYEAHLWDSSCKKEGVTRKGRQVYLGGYDMEEKAAKAYDQAALKYWGPSTHLNFPLENYQHELEEMKNMTRQEYVARLRRKSSGFSRGASIYRGVTRHHQHGRWQARIGRVAGNKDLYLGTFNTQEEAAEAYDIAAIKFRGANAVTNFDISRYGVEKLATGKTLVAHDLAVQSKDKDSDTKAIECSHSPSLQPNRTEPFQSENNNLSRSDCKMTLCQSPHHRQNELVPHHHTTQRNGLMQFENDNVNGLDWKRASYQSPYQRQNELMGALQDMILSQPVIDEPLKLGGHISDPSSLVTSLSSSREASPDKACPSGLSAKPPPSTTKLMGPASTVNPWISMAHLPVFAAWNDA
ncbi:hypothetical protein NMG60_11031265 [Bertholletia excelsa]